MKEVIIGIMMYAPLTLQPAIVDDLTFAEAIVPVQFYPPPDMPVPVQPPGMRPLPRRNYWEYQPRPFPEEGPGRWRYHGESSPYWSPYNSPRDPRLYREFCDWGGRCR